MTIEFTIPGNQQDPDGNPFPKAKLTGGQQWNPIAQRYVKWKGYVQKRFLDHGVFTDGAPDDLAGLQRTWDLNLYRLQKPIAPGEKKARMDLMIHWGKGKRPDPENVFGSIADALFVNDENLAGSFDFEKDPEGKGRVEVKITI